MTESSPPVGMPPLPLPPHSASLDSQGLQQLLATAREDPSIVATVIEQLQSDPKGTVAALFNLTPAQQEAVTNTPDADFAARVAPAIQALQEGQLDGWVFDPGTVDPAVAIKIICTCTITFG
jgi:hypothetical protein